MSIFLAELRRIVSDFEAIKMPWCLVGGLGLSAYAEPRTTKDIDIVVSVSDESALGAVVGKLEGLGYGSPHFLVRMDPMQRLGYRMMVPSDREYSLPLDILSSTCGIENEIVSSAVNIEILPGLFLPIALRGHILAMKILSQNEYDRIQDKADVRALLGEASDADLDVARKALSLITERGYNRGKDLNAELNSAIVARNRP
jgi:hypothetical protein